jgi:hypothetical protein
VTAAGLDDAAFRLRALRHGCGLGLSLAEINDLEWPDIQHWSDMLTEFLEHCFPPSEKKDETPTL